MLPSLLVLAILRGSPVVQPTIAACQDVQRVELTREHDVLRELCISPGLLTGFVFDDSVIVELEDESRFTQVTRGNTGISFIPSRALVKGERPRLTARFQDGASVTFILVVHSGEATRQVEVYRDKRTRESLENELAQEHARNQQLQRELERLHHQLERLRVESQHASELRNLIADGVLNDYGIRARRFYEQLQGDEKESVSVRWGTAYRTSKRVAVAVRLRNGSDTPWLAIEASLVNARGEELTGIRLWQQDGPMPPGKTGLVVVELDAEPQEHHGEFTLRLREDGPRTLNVPQVVFPR